MTITDLQNMENSAVSVAVAQRMGCASTSVKPIAEELSTLAEICHSKLINSLIASYVYHFASSLNISDAMLVGFECRDFELIPLKANIARQIPSLCDQLHADFLNSEFRLDKGSVRRVSSKTNFIEKGAVYTKSDIAHKIVEATVDNWFIQHSEEIPVVLDFACGTGRFYEQVVDSLSCRGIDVLLIILKKNYMQLTSIRWQLISLG